LYQEVDLGDGLVVDEGVLEVSESFISNVVELHQSISISIIVIVRIILSFFLVDDDDEWRC